LCVIGPDFLILEAANLLFLHYLPQCSYLSLWPGKESQRRISHASQYLFWSNLYVSSFSYDKAPISSLSSIPGLKGNRNENHLQGSIASFIIGRSPLSNILRFYFTSYSIVSSGRGMIPHFQPKAGDLLSLPEMSREPFQIVIWNLEVFQSAFCLYYNITSQLKK
jgi:hypothetical protein